MLGVIGVARILSAAVHFFTTQQKLLKIDSCSGWGVHFVSCGGALTHFSCKLSLKKFFFTALGVQVHPPGYAYARSAVCWLYACVKWSKRVYMYTSLQQCEYKHDVSVHFILLHTTH